MLFHKILQCRCVAFSLLPRVLRRIHHDDTIRTVRDHLVGKCTHAVADQHTYQFFARGVGKHAAGVEQFKPDVFELSVLCFQINPDIFVFVQLFHRCHLKKSDACPSEARPVPQRLPPRSYRRFSRHAWYGREQRTY